MIRRRRHEIILARLAERNAVEAEQLAREFDVDVVTIRRDLASLAGRGLLVRTHGGALPAPRGRVEFTFQQHHQAHEAEKAAIARQAAALVQPGMSISLDTGSTTLAVARRLAHVSRLRVLTSSLAIAAELCRCDNLELVLLGGTVRKDSPDMFGVLTEENLRRFRVNVAFIGVDAASPDGLFTTDANVARVSAAMIDGAQRSVVVADSSKFAATAFVRFAGWDRISDIITDDAASPDVRDWLARTGARTSFAVVEKPAI
ncbi:MAG: DeoR/GlpR family DNA-binding transcription regulator [Phycisphaerae bacterium]|nr:DeoR/GlpR family DNA-binding transcription regulator [Phycisphaerae bacterium]